jgi:phage host-nuclease inhibitor protein Gam
MNPFEQDLDQLYREAKRLEMEFDELISVLEKEYHECLDELYKRIEGVERSLRRR